MSKTIVSDYINFVLVYGFQFLCARYYTFINERLGILGLNGARKSALNFTGIITADNSNYEQGAQQTMLDAPPCSSSMTNVRIPASLLYNE